MPAARRRRGRRLPCPIGSLCPAPPCQACLWFCCCPTLLTFGAPCLCLQVAAAAKKAAEKKAKAAAAPAAAGGKKKAEEVEELDPTKYRENRIAAMNKMEEAGGTPYPHKFHVRSARSSLPPSPCPPEPTSPHHGPSSEV